VRGVARTAQLRKVNYRSLYLLWYQAKLLEKTALPFLTEKPPSTKKSAANLPYGHDVANFRIFSKPWGKTKTLTQGRKVAKIFKKKIRFCLIFWIGFLSKFNFLCVSAPLR
jgi:hypothetical protein